MNEMDHVGDEFDDEEICASCREYKFEFNGVNADNLCIFCILYLLNERQDQDQIREYLIERLRLISDDEIEFMMPQLAQMALTWTASRATPLISVLVDRCSVCLHFAFKLTWWLEAASHYLSSTAAARSEDICSRIEIAVVNGKRSAPRYPSLSITITDNTVTTHDKEPESVSTVVVEKPSTEDVSAFVAKQVRSEFFNAQLAYFRYLRASSEALTKHTRPSRKKLLPRYLSAFQPYGLYFPCFAAADEHFRIRQVFPQEGVVLNSRDKAPFLLWAEIEFTGVNTGSPDIYHAFGHVVERRIPSPAAAEAYGMLRKASLPLLSPQVGSDMPECVPVAGAPLAVTLSTEEWHATESRAARANNTGITDTIAGVSGARMPGAGAVAGVPVVNTDVDGKDAPDDALEGNAVATAPVVTVSDIASPASMVSPVSTTTVTTTVAATIATAAAAAAEATDVNTGASGEADDVLPALRTSSSSSAASLHGLTRTGSEAPSLALTHSSLPPPGAAVVRGESAQSPHKLSWVLPHTTPTEGYFPHDTDTRRDSAAASPMPEGLVGGPDDPFGESVERRTRRLLRPHTRASSTHLRLSSSSSSFSVSASASPFASASGVALSPSLSTPLPPTSRMSTIACSAIPHTLSTDSTGTRDTAADAQADDTLPELPTHSHSQSHSEVAAAAPLSPIEDPAVPGVVPQALPPAEGETHLLSVIFKGGDDCRQEVLAMQLIELFDQVWSAAGLPLLLRPYAVLVTSHDSGMIETVTGTTSIDGLKKGVPGFTSLAQFFSDYWGSQGTNTLNDALQGYVQSLAAYSLVCYFLQIKDRHNGNILLDNEGRIVHIDFGFMLSSSPGGNMNFEDVPFKLTQEYLEVLGGQDSNLFSTFIWLFIQGFLEARKHAHKFLLLVQLMQDANMVAYLAGGDRVVEALRQRFRLDLSEQECMQHASTLVQVSCNHWRSVQYDKYQYTTNGIW